MNSVGVCLQLMFGSVFLGTITILAIKSFISVKRANVFLESIIKKCFPTIRIFTHVFDNFMETVDVTFQMFLPEIELFAIRICTNEFFTICIGVFEY